MFTLDSLVVAHENGPVLCPLGEKASDTTAFLLMIFLGSCEQRCSEVIEEGCENEQMQNRKASTHPRSLTRYEQIQPTRQTLTRLTGLGYHLIVHRTIRGYFVVNNENGKYQ